MITLINKAQARELLEPFHYLSKEANGFRVGVNFGAKVNGRIEAVCVFHSPSVPETVKGAFGLDRTKQDGIYELGRLVRHPESSIILSQFVSRCIRELKKTHMVKAILSYADSRYHNGYIYQACNFQYYGLTATRKDFWFKKDDGSLIKHSRGKVKGFNGIWKPRSRKHRYLLIFDKGLKVKWSRCAYPKGNNLISRKQQQIKGGKA